MNYGILSLLPPIIAVILAIKSRNVILSLFCGGLTGVLIFSHGNPFLAVKSMIGDYLFVQLTDSYNAGVIVLVVFIGGFIKLMEKSGGAQAFGQSAYRYVNTKLKAQLCAWAGGIIIFFSDLGTPLLVGPVFRPLFDKLKISREKLAWILDSTSSPVQAIPFQIYAILAIIMIPLIAFTKIDFFQMKKVEQKAEKEKADYNFTEHEEEKENTGVYSKKNAKLIMVILPIIVVFVTLFATLAPLGFPFKKVDGNEFRVALTMGYFFGALVLILMICLFKVMNFGETFKVYVGGMKGMTDVAITLILAWSLGSMISELGTAQFIVDVLKSMSFSAALVPAAIFLFGAFVSFSTGSSWGTFAIMMPLAIPMAQAFSIPFAIAVGAVLSGGLFGDHCSPISDTTILSSTGAECDLVEHVRTQLPYALVNGVIALIAFIIAGATKSAVSLGFAVVALIVVVFVINKVFNKKAAA